MPMPLLFVCCLALLLWPPRTAAEDLSIRFQGDFTSAEKQKLTLWLEHSAATLSTVSGRFPLEQANIRVTATHNGRGPVPWARVIRHRQEGIHFYVDPGYPAQAYYDDWTALHEFSHLLIPYPGDNDIWFSEGLASYYQNLLRGRSGVVTPQQALEDLDAGFRRGEKDARRKRRSLRELSPAMWRTGSYMRVYWSGAAYFLTVDMALRTERDTSLDRVLSDFIACCRQLNRQWNAATLIATLDRLSESELFSYYHRQIIDDRAFPDLSEPYQQLGLIRTSTGLKMSQSAEAIESRKALFRVPDPTD
ncbi:hypothetical protein KUV89_17855 [Marinobacter hydrocarbonoclasticus]|nr:hypothetical protein [Marinobacter nauticus]